MPDPLSSDLLGKMHAYWRAANYLSVGQIYLQDNPLLESPLRLDHIKPRLLGHWGTTPGLNFLYVHLNRLIKENDLNMMYVIGPGHGGPGLVAHTYLEGLVHGALSGDRAQPQRTASALSPVLLALRHPQPCVAGNARLHPRRRRIGLFIDPRLWRGLRQSGSDRRLRHRRWRGGNRRAGHQLALQQISEPGARWRCSADPSSQRLQDRQSNGSGSHQPRGTDGAVARLRLRSAFRRGRRSGSWCIKLSPARSTRFWRRSARFRAQRGRAARRKAQSGRAGR